MIEYQSDGVPGRPLRQESKDRVLSYRLALSGEPDPISVRIPSEDLLYDASTESFHPSFPDAPDWTEHWFLPNNVNVSEDVDDARRH
jgi:hypothetical protein